MENTDIFSSLTPAALRVVRDFQKRGWEFTDGYWESHHNGTPYYDVDFRSPRMAERSTIPERDWPNITYPVLLEKEAREIANEALDKLTSRTSPTKEIENAIIEKFMAHFMSSEKAKIKYADDLSTQCQVKFSRSAERKVSNIKVTIELS
jgi:hypothetical protein